MKISQGKLNMLCQNDSERKILLSLEKMGKNVSQISELTGIPRTSLLYMLKKLEARKIVRKVTSANGSGKRVIWRLAFLAF